LADVRTGKNRQHLLVRFLRESVFAVKWTRLSCRSFAANAVRLQLHALTTSAISCETLAMPKAAEPWSLTSLRRKLIKIGAKVVGHGRYVTFRGRSRGAATDVPGYPAANRPAAGTAGAGMSRLG
jgi:hypothetical protein